MMTKRAEQERQTEFILDRYADEYINWDEAATQLDALGCYHTDEIETLLDSVKPRERVE